MRVGREENQDQKFDEQLFLELVRVGVCVYSKREGRKTETLKDSSGATEGRQKAWKTREERVLRVRECSTV